MTTVEGSARLSSSPAEMRGSIRNGLWRGPTPGCCAGFAQVNVVILPYKYAFDFLLFCQRNPKPCPLLEVMEAGVFEPRRLAPGADIRTDCPRYRVFQGQRVRETDHIKDLWRDDLVTFLLGCSFTFERAMLEAGIPVRHIQEARNVPMYITDRPCDAAGPFRGNLVVSMRPVPAGLVSRAIQITSRYPDVHGAPVQVGDPAGIGIRDIDQPDFGDAVTLYPEEIPVFWACGVTPQVAILAARPELAVTHAPGHMFITDRTDKELAVF